MSNRAQRRRGSKEVIPVQTPGGQKLTVNGDNIGTLDRTILLELFRQATNTTKIAQAQLRDATAALDMLEAELGKRDRLEQKKAENASVADQLQELTKKPIQPKAGKK